MVRAKTVSDTNSSYSDLGLRDVEIKAHANFRKSLYDYDVVPEAEAAAQSCITGSGK